MKSRIRGGDAARAAVATTERLPVPLQATDLVGPFQPMPEVTRYKKPPRVRKPSARHDVIHAPTADLDAHRAMLRITFGTFSEEFADTMMGKVISGLRPNAYDLLIAQHVNAQNGRAIVSDDTISDKTSIPKRWVLRARQSLRTGVGSTGGEPRRQTSIGR